MTTVYKGSDQTFGINTGTTTAMFGFCTVAKHATHLERDGTRGTRSHDIDDVVEGTNTCSGQIIFNPTNADLNLLEPYVIGAGGTVDEALGNFKLEVDRGNDVYNYSNCKIDRMTLRGTQGGLIECVMDVVGRAETATASAPAEPSSATPLAFHNVALTLQGTAREVKEFELVVDNALIKDRFNMNQTAIDFPEGDRIVTLRTVHDWSSNTSGLYNEGIGGATGTLVLADGTTTRTYTFGILQVPSESPPLADRGPLQLTLNMTARKDGSTMEIART